MPPPRTKLTSSWQCGYQADVTVTNTSSEPVTGWSCTTPCRTVSPSRTHNGSLAPGASTTWGMTLDGADRNHGTFSCTAS
ncbi:cellulose binding domain-containing protein [Streptomyces sp. NPDC101152]|uniref:cellulose binding domain-containing protein n=1 Tax=Streptomyces sp. NPDC101152 TaxID=3366116 RepID=UPI00381F47CA